MDVCDPEVDIFYRNGVRKILWTHRNCDISSRIWRPPGVQASAASSIRTLHEGATLYLLFKLHWPAHKGRVTRTQLHPNNLSSNTKSSRCWRFPSKHVFTDYSPLALHTGFCGLCYENKSQMLCISFCKYCAIHASYTPTTFAHLAPAAIFYCEGSEFFSTGYLAWPFPKQLRIHRSNSPCIRTVVLN